MSGAILVLGARNLGGAVLDHFLALGWRGAAVARSADTLAEVRGRGALALDADAADPRALADAMERAWVELGGLDVIVNAVSAARRPPGDGPFGGGPIGEAHLDGYRGWGGGGGAAGLLFLQTRAPTPPPPGGGAPVPGPRG